MWVRSGFGRHHNQLQGMLNIAMWARTLNRTAVLGMFLLDASWHDPSLFYNFTRIMQQYCLVNAATFATQWQSSTRRNRDHSSYCVGETGVEYTPTAQVVTCIMYTRIPGFYDVRRGVQLTEGVVHRLLTDPPLRDAPFIGLDGEMAFFMRAGLVEHAAIFGLLDPADVILDRVRAMFMSPDGAVLQKPSPFTRRRGGPPADANGTSTRLRELGSYFAVHLRRREGGCGHEMTVSFTDGLSLDGYFENVCAVDRRIIRRQCQLTADGVLDLLRYLQGQPSSYERNDTEAETAPRRGISMISLGDMPLFVASDRQNAAVDEALRKQGAVFAPVAAGAGGGSEVLADLSLDYFLLSHEEAAYFTGNQLSSVSQNVCYRRLGRGQACHGFHREFAEYHARNVAPLDFVSNLIVEPHRRWEAGLRDYFDDGLIRRV